MSTPGSPSGSPVASPVGSPVNKSPTFDDKVMQAAIAMLAGMTDVQMAAVAAVAKSSTAAEKRPAPAVSADISAILARLPAGDKKKVKAHQCVCTTTSGARCRVKVAEEGGKCSLHRCCAGPKETAAEAVAAAAKAGIAQCQACTAKGSQCSKVAKYSDGFCTQHHNMGDAKRFEA